MPTPIRVSTPRTRFQGALLGIFLTALAGGTGARAQAPIFSGGPNDGVASSGESFELSAGVSGAEPIFFQWSVGGVPILNATNRSLLLTDLSVTNTGVYQLTATNSVGTLSTNVTLIVNDVPARTIYVGSVSTNEDVVRVPIRLRPNGVENSVGFSLRFDPEVLSEPVFEPALGSADLLTLDEGTVGTTIRLPNATRFAPTDTLLGDFRFKLAAGKSPWNGRLGLTNHPVGLGAKTATNSSLGLTATAWPQLRRLDPLPVLSRQTGLFHQRVEVANATATEFPNINLLVLELQADSLGKGVTVYNAVASQRVDTDLDGDADLEFGVDCVRNDGTPCEAGTEGCRCEFNPDINGDGIIDLAPLYSIDNLAAGEVRELLLEYFVTDLQSAPHPRYAFQLGLPITVTVSRRNTAIAFNTNGIVDGHTMLGFRTTKTNRYFIQYAATAEGLGTPAEVKTARPSIMGNGSQFQWIDYGPPKTDPLPSNGHRFYRIVEGF
jgi:hypothetical protein